MKLRKKILDHIQHILDPITHILDQNHNFGRRNFMKIFTWQIYKNEQGAQIWKKNILDQIPHFLDQIPKIFRKMRI